MSQYEDGPDQPMGRREMRKRKKRSGGKIFAFFLIFILGAVAIAGTYLYSQLNRFTTATHTFERSFPENEEERPEETDAVNVLLLGSDSRGGSGETENLPTVPNGGRSDTIMILHIPKNGDKAYIMSIMRDFWVPIPGHGEAKVNAALAFGGVPLTVQTIENMMGIRIDHVAGVDFGGFQDVVEALGTVTIDVPVAFTSRVIPGHYFEKGTQEMDAETALAFVRERKVFADGDYQRVRNQQAFMEGVFAQLASRENLTNPARTTELIDTLGPAISTDETLTPVRILSLAPSVAGISPSDIESFTLPNNGTGTAQGQSVVWPDFEKITELGKAMNGNDLEAWLGGQDL